MEAFPPTPDLAPGPGIGGTSSRKIDMPIDQWFSNYYKGVGNQVWYYMGGERGDYGAAAIMVLQEARGLFIRGLGNCACQH